MHEVTRVSQRLGDKQKSRPTLRYQKWKVLFPGNSRDGGVGYCQRIVLPAALESAKNAEFAFATATYPALP